MKRIKRILVIAIVCVFLAASAIHVSPATVSTAFNPDASDSSVLLSLHKSYKDATQIVLCTCIESYTAATGSVMSRFLVGDVYDGSLFEGDVISLSVAAAEGERYLLYLGNGGGASYAEDEAGYTIVTDSILPVRGDSALFMGSRIGLDVIRNDIEEQRGVLTVPAQSFYYDDVRELIHASDEVFLGSVVDVSAPIKTLCRSDEKGESVLNTLSATYVTIRVLNGMGSSYSYGDIVELVLLPSRLHSVINSTDLSAKKESVSTIMPEELENYMFFLTHSNDEKSDYCFTVNPYQGYVRLDGDSLIRPYYNGALSGISELSEFTRLINGIMGF